MLSLDTPEAHAVIKGEPNTIGYRGGQLRLPRVLLLMFSQPVESAGEFARGFWEGISTDFGIADYEPTEKCTVFGVDLIAKRKYRLDVLQAHIAFYLEQSDTPETLVRMFRRLREQDPGATLCDNRGEPLFDCEVV